MGINSVFMVRLDRPASLPDAAGEWREADADEQFWGCTHVCHSGWRFFSETYKRGHWPSIRAVLVQLMRLGPAWYSSSASASPGDMVWNEPRTPETYADIAAGCEPFTDRDIARLDAAWARHLATSAPTTTPTASPTLPATHGHPPQEG